MPPPFCFPLRSQTPPGAAHPVPVAFGFSGPCSSRTCPVPPTTSAASRRPGRDPGRALWGCVGSSSRDPTEAVGFRAQCCRHVLSRARASTRPAALRVDLDLQADVCAPASPRPGPPVHAVLLGRRSLCTAHVKGLQIIWTISA